jgi:pyruvate/2-oxoglutarate dehydrogenase complex dihydrolipoamide dehydrogenase (E3) component
MARQWAIRSNDNKPPAAVDFHQVRDLFRTKQRLIYERDDSPEALKAFGVDTIHGRARLTSRHTLSVAMNDDESDEHTITARYGILWCTGATAKKQIDIPGLETVTVVTYEDVWQLESLPETLTVVGGGPVGCELAQALARLGSKVTMVAGRLLPREEPEVSRILQQVFEEDENITIVNGRLERVERNGPAGGHTAIVSLNEDSSKEIKVEGDVMLLSIGRTPNTRGMGLENVGVDLLDNGGISVNDRLQTSLKGVYAAGDCIGEKQFTHYAGYQGAIAARNILLPLTDPGVLSDVPASTFTSPEVASVGHSEASAKEKYGVDAVAVSKMNLEEVDRAVCDGATKGFLKVIYKKRGGKILGVTIMAPCAGELISEISVAKAAGMSFPSMAKAIHPYPSYAIALQMMASEAYYEEVGKYRAILDFLKRLGL